MLGCVVFSLPELHGERLLGMWHRCTHVVLLVAFTYKNGPDVNLSLHGLQINRQLHST